MTEVTKGLAANPFSLMLADQTKLFETFSFKQQELLSEYLSRFKPVDDALKVAKMILSCNPAPGRMLDNARLIVGYSMRNTPHDVQLILEVRGCPASGAYLHKEADELLLAWTERNLPPAEPGREPKPFETPGDVAAEEEDPKPVGGDA